MMPRQRLILVVLLPLTWAAMYLIGSLAPPLIIDYNPYLPWMILAGDVPLVVALLFAWQFEQPRIDYFQPELIGLFGIWISLINGYVVAFFLPYLNVLPQADPSAPAPLNLPINIWAVGIIAGVTLFFFWFLFRRNSLAERADRIYLPHRRIALLVTLAAMVLLVSLLGGTDFGWALLPSVWLWPFILPRPHRAGKLLNLVLAMGGMVWPLGYGLLALGSGGWWRAVLAAIYGDLNFLEVALFLLWVSVFVRFIRLGFSKPYVAPAAPEDVLFQLIKPQ